MDTGTLLNVGLVIVFVLVGGVFAATEIALVSLRESQLSTMERSSSRGAHVARVARDPNRFLAAVQIGVTLAGFFSAAYGASTLADDLTPLLVDLGMSEGALKVAAHRLRERYRHVLRAEVADTVAASADVDAELRHLIEAL